MIFMLPFLFGAVGLAVGAVAGALTTHAVGEKDRQAAKHHRQIANELTNKYTNLERNNTTNLLMKVKSKLMN